jgi:hypothetical protein
MAALLPEVRNIIGILKSTWSENPYLVSLPKIMMLLNVFF